jgi:hypothetical protein
MMHFWYVFGPQNIFMDISSSWHKFYINSISKVFWTYVVNLEFSVCIQGLIMWISNLIPTSFEKPFTNIKSE